MINAIMTTQRTSKRQKSRDVIKIVRQNNRFERLRHKNIFLFYYKLIRLQRAILLVMAIEPGLTLGLINAPLTGYSALIVQMLLSSLGLSRALSQSMYTIRKIIPYSLPVRVRVIAR